MGIKRFLSLWKILSILVLTSALLPLPATVGAPQDETLVFGIESDAANLDPQDIFSVSDTLVSQQIFEGLLRFKGETTALEPGLATSYRVSDDGLVWTFQLRDDVEFQDGPPLTAFAVQFSWERALNPNHPMAGFGRWNLFTIIVRNVKAIEADGRLTVRVVLSRPYSPILNVLAAPHTGVASPKGLGRYTSDFGRNPVGTGPFRFVQWKKDDEIVLERNERYWGPKPRIQRLIFKVIPDSATRLLALERGSIQAMRGVDPALASRIKANKNLNLIAAISPASAYLAMNNQKPPFTDRRVRQAIAHAINVQQIVDAFWQGYGARATDVLPPMILGYNPKVQPYEYNPQKAKQLLSEAGYPEGFTTSLLTWSADRPYLPSPRKVAEAIQADLAKVGIKVVIETLEAAALIAKSKQAGHEMLLTGFIAPVPDPSQYMFLHFDTENMTRIGFIDNYSLYSNPEIDRINREATLTADPGKRASLYQRAQEIIMRDIPRIDIAWSQSLVATRSNLRGIVLNPSGYPQFGGAFYR